MCFTDGACIPNPGPCAAGAMLYIPGEEDIQIKRPATVHGLILLAILAILDHLIIGSSRIKSLWLFCDSQTALGIITLNLDFYQPPDSNVDYFNLIKESIGRACNTNIIDILILLGILITASHNHKIRYPNSFTNLI